MNAWVLAMAVLFLVSGGVVWKSSSTRNTRDLGIIIFALGALGLITMAVKIVYFILVP